VEVLGDDVAGNAGEGDVAIAPLSKGEVKFVVFYPSNAGNISLAKSALYQKMQNSGERTALA
jgi:hypothetical protein